MRFTTIFSLLVGVIIISSSVSAAISVSQSYSQDLVRVKERWSYQEDTSGRHRGFNLIHVYSVPRENLEVNYNDRGSGAVAVNNPATSVQTFSVLDSGFGSGIVGSQATRIVDSGSSGGIGINSASFGYSNIGYGGGSSAGLGEAFSTYQRNSQRTYGYNTYGYYGYTWANRWGYSPGYTGYWGW